MATTWSRGRSSVLRIVSLGQAALAAVFLVLALLIPLWPLLISAAVLALVAVLVFSISRALDRAAAARERLLRDGVEATATITAMRQTALMVNGQPQVVLDLNVSVGMRPPYPLQVKEFVPLIYVGRLSSGAPLSLRVDPDNAQRIAIDWTR